MVLTLRNKNLDNFAFPDKYELGHIFEHLHPNRDKHFLDIEHPAVLQNKKEQAADHFAKECFIENSTWHVQEIKMRR